MAYSRDLELYRYGTPFPLPGVRSVGWLDDTHPFPTGDVPPQVPRLLRELALTLPVNQMRGFHTCELCGQDWRRREDVLRLLGSAEIWLKTASGYWAAPDLIIHYIEDHRYRPPDELLRELSEVNRAADIAVSQSQVDAILRQVERS